MKTGQMEPHVFYFCALCGRPAAKDDLAMCYGVRACRDCINDARRINRVVENEKRTPK